jgi:hypothetical protein
MEREKAFFDLSLYEHPSGAQFDPNAAIQKVKTWFPDATVLPGDQLALRAQHAEKIADQLGAEGSRIVSTLWRNAKLYGPAYAFRIPLPGGSPIEGLARRVNVQFLFEEPLPQGMRERLLDFLKSFGVGCLTASTNDERQFEILCDMPGTPAHPGEAILYSSLQNQNLETIPKRGLDL